MAFCSQCGNRVADTDQYCAKCGARQPAAVRAASDPLENMNPRTAAVLCYVPWLGWIAAIVVLASNRFRDNSALRFHAFQGLYLFVAWLMVDYVLKPLFHIMPGPTFPFERLFQLAILGVWVFMMIKASHGEQYSLPIIGELAERSVTER
jgi:uncharacterized membrane protein